MIQITTSELKANIAHYISIVEKEDILITRNGKTVAKLIAQKPDKVGMTKSLFGILKGAEIDEKALSDERRATIRGLLLTRMLSSTLSLQESHGILLQREYLCWHQKKNLKLLFVRVRLPIYTIFATKHSTMKQKPEKSLRRC